MSRLVIDIRPEDLARLSELAANERRDVRDQASYLLEQAIRATVLREKVTAKRAAELAG
jgi:predicted transcriptional regulator